MSAKQVTRTNPTRVTTGKQLFLGRVDERSLVARRYREVLSSIVSDLAGAEEMSEAEMIIARRAASLVVMAEQYESKMAEGSNVDLTSYLPVVNSLMRMLQTLGLKRRPKNVGPSPLQNYHDANTIERVRDVTDDDQVEEAPQSRRVNEAIAAVANGSDSRPQRYVRSARA